MLAKAIAIFLLLWVLTAFLIMASDHYVAAGVMFGTWSGLYLWSFLRGSE